MEEQRALDRRLLGYLGELVGTLRIMIPPGNWDKEGGNYVLAAMRPGRNNRLEINFFRSKGPQEWTSSTYREVDRYTSTDSTDLGSRPINLLPVLMRVDRHRQALLTAALSPDLVRYVLRGYGTNRLPKDGISTSVRKWLNTRM